MFWRWPRWQAPMAGRTRSTAPFALPPSGKAVSDAPKMIKFVPFDPAKKMSEATATNSTGSPQRIVKGAFAVVIGLAPAVADRDSGGERT